MENNKPEIFISYAWGGESEKIVDELHRAFVSKKIEVIRDKINLGFKGNIKEFMQNIGLGKCIIIVINDKYLKSPNCMYEIVQIQKKGDLYNRIFPIVLSDADIYKPKNRLNYIKHWQNEVNELNDAMKAEGVDISIIKEIQQELSEYREILNSICGITTLLKDINTLTPDIHKNSNFNHIITEIEKMFKFDLQVPLDNVVVERNDYNFKTLGNLHTKMLTIFPYKKHNSLKIENVHFTIKYSHIYDQNILPYFYNKITKHINKNGTIYNEAKLNLLDYNITRNEEDNQHHLELILGISCYIDFLSINRNLDVLTDKYSRETIREQLISTNVDFDFLNQLNSTPKQLGVSSIIISKDNKIVFQKRQKSEVASKMYHVSIAEGLQAYKSYNEYLNLNVVQKRNGIVDTTLKDALLRGLHEELGIERKEVTEVELLSCFYDYELQQPIFQTYTIVNLNASELNENFKIFKGIDTLAEISKLDFVENEIDDLLLYFYQTCQNGKWSTHAVINIISFLESFFPQENLITKVNKYFKYKELFTLGKQNYVETI